MSMREYIGMRYVPLFADPLEWDNTRTYEPLTIVLYQGSSYTSRQAVPVGIDIANTEFWALTGNYNAQIEQYRTEMSHYDSRITAAEQTAENAVTQVGLVGDAVDDIESTLDGFDPSNTVASAISTLSTSVNNLDNKVGTLPEGETSVVEYVSGALSEVDTSIGNLETTLTGFGPTEQVKSYVDNAVASVASAKGDMVVISDSFTSSFYVQDSSLWYHDVAKFLNCNGHNYSQRGSGYLNASTQDGSTFQTLLQDAISDTTFDNENVKWVFVYGGLNDIEHANADTAFSTYFNNFCNSVSNNFPNAQLVVLGINAWKTGFSFYHTGTNWRGQIWYEQTMKGQTGFINAKGIFVSMCGALGFNDSWYDSSNNHPNAAGHKALSSWILSAMFGSGLMRSASTNFSVYESSAAGAGTLTLHLAPGLIEFQGQTTAAQANEYLLDGLSFFKDQAVDVRGKVIGTDRAGTHVFGWLGAKNGAGYINTVENGFFYGTRRF